MFIDTSKQYLIKLEKCLVDLENIVIFVMYKISYYLVKHKIF